MAVLSHVGKPLQASDTLFMTEWVAIFRESGLRDDVSVENLREACLQLAVCARARARELQVDVQVERASRAVVSANTVTPTKGKSKPAMETAVCKFFLTADGCKFGDDCKYKERRTNGKCLRCLQKDTRFLPVHDLPRRSLRASLSNRLKERGDLPLPRLRPNLPRVPSQRHRPRKTVPKEEVKVRRISLLPSLLTILPRRPPSLPRSLLRNPVPSLLRMRTQRRRIRMRRLNGVRTRSMLLRRSPWTPSLITPLRLPTILMSVLHMT